MVNVLTGAAAGSAIQIVIRAIDNYSKEFKKLDKSIQKQQSGLKKLGGFLKSTGIGYAALAGAAVGFAVESTKAFVESERAAQAFNAVLGDTADLMLRDLRRASNGLASDFALMDSANKALALGIDKNQLPELLKVAAARGKVTGRTVTQAFEDISIGIGRQSRLILDNLGIILDLDDAYEEYARQVGKTKDQLTEFEKKQAVTNKVLEESRFITMLMSAQQETLSEQTQRISAEYSNLKVEVGRFFGSILSAIIETKDAVSDFISEQEVLDSASRDVLQNKLVPRFKELQDQAQDAAQAVEDIGRAMDDLVRGPFEDVENKEREIALVELELAKQREFLAKATDETQRIFGEGVRRNIEDLEEERKTLEAELDTMQARIDVVKETNDVTRLFSQDAVKNTNFIIDEQLRLNQSYVDAITNVTKIKDATKEWEEQNKETLKTTNNLFDRFLDLVDRISRRIRQIPGVGDLLRLRDLGNPRRSIPFAGSFAEGGVVPRTGMALVHKGETVIPNDGSIAGGVTIIVEGSVIGLDEEDISRRLADELNNKVSL